MDQVSNDCIHHRQYNIHWLCHLNNRRYKLCDNYMEMLVDKVHFTLFSLVYKVGSIDPLDSVEHEQRPSLSILSYMQVYIY